MWNNNVQNAGATSQSPRNKVRSLNYSYTNGRSLVNKLDALCAWAEAENPDIIGISETWGQQDIIEGIFFHLSGYHPPFRKDRATKAGWVMLYVKENLNETSNEELNSMGSSACVWCNILAQDGSKLRVRVCHRHDTAATAAAAEEVADLPNVISDTSKTQILTIGNFNHEITYWVNLTLQAGGNILDLEQKSCLIRTPCVITIF